MTGVDRRIIVGQVSGLETPIVSTPRTGFDGTAFQTPGTPNAPTDLSLAAGAGGGDIWVTANWSAPTANGAGQVTHWAIEVLRDGDSLPDITIINADLFPPYVIRGLFPNQLYHISVRALTAAGASSTPLSGDVTTGYDTTPAAQVMGLSGSAGYKSVMLKWTQFGTTLAPFLGKFIVEQATDSGFSTGYTTYDNANSNLAVVANLSIGTTYYFRVYAISPSGVAGTPSSTVSLTPGTLPTSDVHDGVVPASNPSQLRVSGGVGSLLVEWTPITNADPVTYEVHVSTSNSFTPSSATLVATVAQLPGAGTGAYSQFAYIKTSDSSNTALAYGTTYYVTVRAKDVDGVSAAALAYASGVMVQVLSDDVGFAVGNGNYVRDANFGGVSSVDTRGGSTDTPFDDWFAYSSYPGVADGALTVSAYATDAFYGPFSCRLQWTTNTGNKGLRQYVPISKGNQYVWPKNTTWMISLWVQNLANPGVPHLAADAAGFTDTYTNNPTPSTSQGWQRWDIKRSVGGADVSTHLYPAWVHANGDLLIGAVQVTQGDTPLSGYSPRPDEVLARSVIAQQIVAGTITGNEIHANTITAGNIVAHTLTAAEIAAGAITTDRLTVATNYPSMVANGSFEDPGASATLAASWDDGSTWSLTAVSGVSERSNTVVSDGQWAWRLGVTTNLATSWARTTTLAFPVTAGDTLACQAQVRNSAANTDGFHFRMIFHTDPNAPPAGDTEVNLVSAGISQGPNSDLPQGTTGWSDAVAGSFQTVSGQVTVPAGKTFCRVQLWNYTPSAANNIDVDGVRITRAAATVMISNGAIVTEHMVAGTINGDIISAGTLDAGAIVAGSITSSSAAIGSLDASKITANTMNAARIGAGTIGAVAIILANGGTIRSANWVNLTSGWSIDGAGNAQVNNLVAYGTINTTSGSLNIQIGSVGVNEITFNTADAVTRGFIQNGSSGYLAIQAPTTSGNYPGVISMLDNLISLEVNGTNMVLRPTKTDVFKTLNLSGVQLTGNYDSTTAPAIAMRTGNTFTTSWDGSTLHFYTDVSNVKNFIIPHPADNERWLIHTTLEGPENAVFYRGQGRLVDGWAEIGLPAYFEALTAIEGRSVQLTCVAENVQDEWCPVLHATYPTDGRFYVGLGSGLVVSDQRFWWEVKAVRRDVPGLLVEPLRDEVTVHGEGPYTYYTQRDKAAA